LDKQDMEVCAPEGLVLEKVPASHAGRKAITRRGRN
jgi:hypothetical protein